jgi:hypothetical protein
MCASRRSRGGFALVAALLAILSMSAVLVAIAFSSRVRQSIVSATRATQRASGAAELGAWIALVSFDSASLLAQGGEARIAQFDASGVDTARAGLVRLGETTYLAYGEAAVRGPGGRFYWRRVGVFGSALSDSLMGERLEPLPDRSWFEFP